MPNFWREMNSLKMKFEVWEKSVLPPFFMYIIFIRIQAGRPKKSFLFGPLFFNITNVFWAKKWVGHACICTGWSLASKF